MIVRSISEAKTELSTLIEAVQKGEEVLIGKAGQPVARLVAYYTGAGERRIPGALAGQIRIHNDFDSPLPDDIAEAFGVR
jgi:prevent-host-death family protein